MIVASTLVTSLRQQATALGFNRVGIIPAGPARRLDAYLRWIADGRHGEMAYLARPDRVERRRDPAVILPGVRSLVVVGLDYHTAELPPAIAADPSRGRFSNYAWGVDYHEVMTPRLEALAAWLREQSAGREVVSRVYVDTGALLERDHGEAAGLGFTGKNTMLIDPRRGSWFFLGVLLTTLPLTPDTYVVGADLRVWPPGSSSSVRDVEGVQRSVQEGAEGHAQGGADAGIQGGPHASAPGGADAGEEGADAAAPLRQPSCGRCQRCLDACPTAAFPAPYVLDARRCISYLTIELKGWIPAELRPLMGNWVYGCDVCQAVCPFNRFAAPTAETAFRPLSWDAAAPPLLDLLALDEEGFARRFAHSPVRRIKRARLVRNACVAAGNWGSAAAVPALVALLADPASIVRGHAAWALHRIDGAPALAALATALLTETDPAVRRELAGE